ncbi:MAG: hypothetical protein LBJ00_05170 [Planctomycetaceae bacterium]|nr:hypothetical protein [Planctomycetaceae bacterium]
MSGNIFSSEAGDFNGVISVFVVSFSVVFWSTVFCPVFVELLSGGNAVCLHEVVLKTEIVTSSIEQTKTWKVLGNMFILWVSVLAFYFAIGYGQSLPPIPATVEFRRSAPVKLSKNQILRI